MKMIKPLIAVLFACCISSVAFAATPQEMPGQPLSALSSDAAEVNDWETLKSELITAFGGDVTETKSQGELDKLTADLSPKAYSADLGAVKFFNIIGQAVPSAMHPKLLDIFKDMKAEDFEEFENGMSLVATKGASNYTVRLILFKEKDNVQQSGTGLTGLSFKLTDDASLKLPAGTEILTEKKQDVDGSIVERYRMRIEVSSKDFRDFVTRSLSEQDVSYKENKAGPITSLIVDVDATHVQLNYETDAEASKTSTVSLTIYRYN
jgi:hypothetical protein